VSLQCGNVVKKLRQKCFAWPVLLIAAQRCGALWLVTAVDVACCYCTLLLEHALRSGTTRHKATMPQLSVIPSGV
jgi:hypothetical protein